MRRSENNHWKGVTISSMTCAVYFQGDPEAADATWRSMPARHIGGSTYLLLDDPGDGETLAYAPREMVRCELRDLGHLGEQLVVVMEVGRRPVWWDLDDDGTTRVPLTDVERTLLWHGLTEWGGPARPSDDIARVIGFEDAAAIWSEGRRICALLDRGDPMSKRDWAAALVATEIGWSSVYYGSGGDWESVTPLSDEETLVALRGLQRKLGGLRNPPRRQTDDGD